MLKIVRSRDICFGRYRFEGRGVALMFIDERFRAGEPIASLMSEFNMTREEIEAAIDWCIKRSKAARKGWRTRRKK